MATGRVDPLRLLHEGELDIRGRLVVSSNAALFCTVSLADDASTGSDSGSSVEHLTEAAAVYKPIAFERPLWDFPDGTLAHREVAAYLVSEATGWGIVPPTVLRDGPAGPGMVQLWIDTDETVDAWDLVEAGDPRLRPMAVFDAIVNNTDRKGGHILPVTDAPAGADAGQSAVGVPDERAGRRGAGAAPHGPGGSVTAVEGMGVTSIDGARLHLFGVDHGVCFSTEPKLRTVLWTWRGTPFLPDELAVLRRIRAELDGELAVALRALLSASEVRATRRRIDRLLAEGCFPQPDPDRPAIPWPPY